MHYLEHLYEKVHYCSVVSGGPKSGKPTYNLWLSPFLSPPTPTPARERSSLPDITQQPHPVLEQESEMSVPHQGPDSQVTTISCSS